MKCLPTSLATEPKTQFCTQEIDAKRMNGRLLSETTIANTARSGLHAATAAWSHHQ